MLARASFRFIPRSAFSRQSSLSSHADCARTKSNSKTVISVATNTVVLQNDLLGKLTLPRDQVAHLTIGEKRVTATNALPLIEGAKKQPALLAQAPSKTAETDLATAIRGLNTNSSSVRQISDQLLTGSNPAAKKKYNELVGGLASGNLSVANIRTEAQSAITQVRQYKKELGEEAGEPLDAYLAVLEGFLKETESSAPEPPKTVPGTQSKPH
jgi:uncharacterized phage infection (PIP) family protein YhgE